METLLAKQFEMELRKLADADLASSMSSYLKDQFRFLGVQKPKRKALVKPFIKQARSIDFENVLTVGEYLWNLPEREFKYVAMEWLFEGRKHWEESIIEHLERMMLQDSWWDTVDMFSGTLAGFYFKSFPDKRLQITKRWAESPNMWLNRAAILFQLKYKKETDLPLLFNYVNMHRKSNEFFHQKAIGWALREYAKINPSAVKEFVNQIELKPLSKREALKHFDR